MGLSAKALDSAPSTEEQRGRQRQRQRLTAPKQPQLQHKDKDKMQSRAAEEVAVSWRPAWAAELGLDPSCTEPRGQCHRSRSTRPGTLHGAKCLCPHAGWGGFPAALLDNFLLKIGKSPNEPNHIHFSSSHFKNMSSLMVPCQRGCLEQCPHTTSPGQ